MTPGATYHGEVCTYSETWSVPEATEEALEDFLTMFSHYLFNVTNTTLFNITLDASGPVEFALRRDLLSTNAFPSQYPAKTPEPGQLYEDIDWDERGRRVLKRPIVGHDPVRDTQNDPARRAPVFVPSTEPPLAAAVHWRNEFDLPELFQSRLSPSALNVTWSNDRHRGIDCALDTTSNDTSAAPHQFSTLPDALVVLTTEFLMGTNLAHDAIMTLTSNHAMRQFLAPFAMVPCRDRSFQCRAILEFDPAPSPPPPNDWVIPPSPPAFAYEVGVAGVAASGTGIYLLFACLCCTCLGGRAVRQRHTSRWPVSSRLLRVENVHHGEEDSRLAGEIYEKQGVPVPATELTGGHAELTFRLWKA